MNKQEVFNKVVLHLLKQNKKSISITISYDMDYVETCMYRNKEGIMCAIGCLIKDEFYSADLESKVVFNPLVMKALELSGVIESDLSQLEHNNIGLFLSELQNIHDNSDPENWHIRLSDFSIKHKLTMPSIANVHM